MRAQQRACAAAAVDLAVRIFFARGCDRLANHRAGSVRKHRLLDLLRNSCLVQSSPHGDQVSQRFKKIKETYSDNYRKVKDSKRSGCGTDDVYKPKWFSWPHVQFLEKVCDMGESVCNIPQPTSQSQVPDNTSSLNSAEPNNPKYLLIDGVPYYFDESLQGYVMMHGYTEFNLQPVENTTEQSSLFPDNSDMESGPTSNNSVSVHSTPTTTPYSTPAPSPRSSSALSATLIRTPSMQQQSTVRIGSGSAPGTVPIPATSPSLKVDSKDIAGGELYKKRGAGKKRPGSAILEEAFTIFKEVAKEPEARPHTLDAADYLAQFIACRLRRLDEASPVRKDCENQLMTLMLQF
ncbi:hypothetical protein QAD02_021296 [Eretmocerus hayati]|uniref:Uncharacterized protein n=1 Tax=Eretmocerus hayati TaxID=131215 RepID=A0ACC2PQV7_9HYME|nr:hypothetical protein QAD02_021296 [Eretmocerus hayati]